MGGLWDRLQQIGYSLPKAVSCKVTSSLTMCRSPDDSTVAFTAAMSFSKAQRKLRGAFSTTRLLSQRVHGSMDVYRGVHQTILKRFRTCGRLSHEYVLT